MKFVRYHRNYKKWKPRQLAAKRNAVCEFICASTTRGGEVCGNSSWLCVKKGSVSNRAIETSKGTYLSFFAPLVQFRTIGSQNKRRKSSHNEFFPSFNKESPPIS